MTTGPQGRLRSQDWFGQVGKDGFIHRSWMRRGLPPDALDGWKPIVGIVTTWSELSPCNMHLDVVAEHVRRGVWESGGVPLVVPVGSIGESNARPTAMLFRNLLAMQIEESIRQNPLDAVVGLSGCDKTTAAMWLGTASVNLPTIIVTGGHMLTGSYRGKPLGSGVDVWRFSEEVRAGALSDEEFRQAESCMTRSYGHCNVMGTASTLAALTQALGLTLPGGASLPAADTRRLSLAHGAGRRIVAMVGEGHRVADLVTAASVRNAVRLNAALSGSTNSVVHLLALSGRLGLGITLDDVDSAGRGIPMLADVAPSGRFMMDDLFVAGGVDAVLRQLTGVLEPARTVTGADLRDDVSDAAIFDAEVIGTLDDPIRPGESGVAVLRGNLAPRGAIIKPAAASPELMQHSGRAVVFDSIEDFRARIDDPDLDVDPSDILVLRGCGPRGYPGMPEVGNMALPKKVLQKGARDMVRISDARMSGTAFGTVVLHVTPESWVGGTLALVRTGDPITLDVAARRLTLDVDEAELQRRRARWSAPPPRFDRGWNRLYEDHVLQADEGADLDFLVGRSSDVVERESH